MKYSLRLLLLMLALLLVACGGSDPEPTNTPVPEPTEEPEPTNEPEPTDEPEPTAEAEADAEAEAAEPEESAEPTAEPASGPLSPSDVFANVSPSIAFIETKVATGSGVLVDGNYILTNAHVVWPYDTARIVFADGSEYVDMPVVGVDLMVDLALIGPIDTAFAPLPLVDGEDIVVGSDVYLIGYPGEVDEFPEPTITRGLISRVREWVEVGITYFQTDAAIAGGQSGGVLVSEQGDVIGISGFSFTEAGFGLAASSADIVARVDTLASGGDADGLGDRSIALDGGETDQSVLLDGEWDTKMFIVNVPPGSEFDVLVEGNGDEAFVVYDIDGDAILDVDEDPDSGEESGTAETFYDAPYFIHIYQYFDEQNVYSLETSEPAVAYVDPDDSTDLVKGDTYLGALDYPGDEDVYVVELEAGEQINIAVDSILTDPTIYILEAGIVDYELGVSDDDDGGGMFGLSAELTFEAARSETHYIVVEDAVGDGFGGYVITVNEPNADSVPVELAPEE